MNNPNFADETLADALIAAQKAIASASNKLFALQAQALYLGKFVPSGDPRRGDVVAKLITSCEAYGLCLTSLHRHEVEHIIAEGLAGRSSGIAGGQPKKVARDEDWRDHVIGAQELCDERYPDVRYIVPNLIPEGVTLLASRPKLGKSWLQLQIGSTRALGESTLSSAAPDGPADVLYLCLEDGRRRLQRRMTKYFGALRANWPKRLTIASEWRRLDEGGIEDLRAWCRDVEKPALIMIDTLKKVRAPKRGGQSDYAADYEACEGLVALAHEFPGLGILVAHHDRKMDAEDPFDTVRTSSTITATISKSGA